MMTRITSTVPVVEVTVAIIIRVSLHFDSESSHHPSRHHVPGDSDQVVNWLVSIRMIRNAAAASVPVK
jgi:hypothetical protein